MVQIGHRKEVGVVGLVVLWRWMLSLIVVVVVVVVLREETCSQEKLASKLRARALVGEAREKLVK